MTTKGKTIAWLFVGAVALAALTHSNNTATTNSGVAYNTGSGYTGQTIKGCPEQYQLAEVARVAHDNAAAWKLMDHYGCREIPPGYEVVETDNGLRCLRPQGDYQCYWAVERYY